MTVWLSLPELQEMGALEQELYKSCSRKRTAMLPLSFSSNTPRFISLVLSGTKGSGESKTCQLQVKSNIFYIVSKTDVSVHFVFLGLLCLHFNDLWISEIIRNKFQVPNITLRKCMDILSKEFTGDRNSDRIWQNFWQKQRFCFLKGITDIVSFLS